jgi:hypothetical protein
MVRSVSYINNLYKRLSFIQKQGDLVAVINQNDPNGLNYFVDNGSTNI